MAIYLDANILCRWRTFNELDYLALRIVADQIGQNIFVPEIAAWEAEAHHRRSLEAALDQYEKGASSLERIFGRGLRLSRKDEYGELIDEIMSDWRDGLDRFALVVPLHPDDAVTALRREIEGVAPARSRIKDKPGAGARDAAIWLTIVRHHGTQDESGHFVSNDKHDYTSGEALKPELAAEATGLTFYAAIGEILSLLGEPTDALFEAKELRDRAIQGLVSVLNLSSSVPRVAVRNQTDIDLRYYVVPTEGEVLSKPRVRRYERGGDSVTVVDAQWHFIAEVWFQEPDTSEPEVWSEVDDRVPVEADVQFFLEETDSGDASVELIRSSVTSPTTLYIEGQPDSYAIRRIDSTRSFMEANWWETPWTLIEPMS